MSTAKEPPATASRAYDDWFTATPDPWEDVAHLDYGGDSTAAATLQRLIVQAEPSQYRALETNLLRVLKRPDLTNAGRVWVCRMLALVGSGVCVVPLSSVLQDSRTADVARYALDRIEDADVDEAYRAALEKLSGAPKVGVIGSMAMRGDLRAREVLDAISRNEAESTDVRAAATRAIERLTAKERIPL